MVLLGFGSIEIKIVISEQYFFITNFFSSIFFYTIFTLFQEAALDGYGWFLKDQTSRLSSVNKFLRKVPDFQVAMHIFRFLRITGFPKKDARFSKLKNIPDLLSDNREYTM